MIYALELPVWLYFINKQSIVGYDVKGVAYAIACLLSYVIAAVLFGYLLKGSSDVGMVSVMVAMNPIVTVLLSVSLLGEQFTLKKGVAAILMLLGLFLFNR